MKVLVTGGAGAIRIVGRKVSDMAVLPGRGRCEPPGDRIQLRAKVPV